jgi:hypothetical protein
MAEPPEQSPLVSEVISAALKQEISESDVIVTCPARATATRDRYFKPRPK